MYSKWATCVTCGGAMSNTGSSLQPIPMSQPLRLVFGFVALNAFIGAFSLIFFPARTDSLFFWPIAPPLSAALFGALYLAGAVVVSLVTWRGLWEPARYLVPILVT